MEIDFEKIISISGMDDLYTFLHFKKGLLTVESLKDGKIGSFFMNRCTVVYISRVEVYGVENNIKLGALFKLMKQANQDNEIDRLYSKDLFYEFFNRIFPEIDNKKVYLSNLKQIVKWYRILSKFDIEQIKN